MDLEEITVVIATMQNGGYTIHCIMDNKIFNANCIFTTITYRFKISLSTQRLNIFL